MGRVRGPERICEVWVWGFAGWTLCANAVVAAGGSLRQLVVLAVLAAGVAGALLLLRGRAACRVPSRGLRASQGHDLEPAPRKRPQAARSEPQASEVIGLVVAVGLVAWLALTRRLEPFWLGAVALLATLLVAELRRHPAPEAPAAPGRHDRVLIGLVAVSLAVVLFAHRPDADDAWFLNLAAAAADQPDAPLLARDTLHGLPGAPSGIPAGLPTYRLHSFELLAGALAWLTPLDVLAAAHLVLAGLGACLLPLAQARLLRLLIPERWAWGVVFAWAFLLAVGDTHLAYGNFGLVRMHQGKALMLCVGLPLVAAYALEFARDPAPLPLARLAAAQVAALGASGSALWIAPAVAGLGLASALPLSARGLRVGLAGLLASAYPLAAGLAMAAGARAALAESGLQHTTPDLAGHALGVVLGAGPAASAALLASLAAGCVARGSLERRFALVFPLGFLLVLWNPFTASWVAKHLTGTPTYWRVFWVLPLPALVGMALSAPLRLPSRRLGVAVALLLAALALVWAPTRSSLSPQNRVRLGVPGPKVPLAPFAAARALARHAGPGARVLAPYPVATWLSTLSHHPTPLAVRGDYLLSLRRRLGGAELVRRGRLVNLVSGKPGDPDAAALLGEAAASGELAAVCIADAAPAAARRALEAAGFAAVERVDGYEIWAPGLSPSGP